MSIPKALKVPASAILTAQDGSKSVMVIGSDGAAHRKPVTLGIQGEKEVQVTKGLAADDVVITTGSYGIDEGTKVKIGPAAGEDGDDAGKDKGDD
jgi:HlyD family secretion protein